MKIAVQISALSHSISNRHSYAVVLTEDAFQKRMVPIIIGGFEAQALAVALEQMNPERPLTHQLMCSVFQKFNIRMKELYIHSIKDGIFYANMILIDKEGKETELDSRTSDGLVLATRFGCPIYMEKNVLEAACTVVDGQASPDTVTANAKQESKIDYESLDNSVLQKMMEEAAAVEDYPKAITIRGILDKRKQNA